MLNHQARQSDFPFLDSMDDLELPAGIILPAHSNRWQEMIRQWILLLPMATAVAGAAILKFAPENGHDTYAPALFMTGALIVTAAMLHQRRMHNLNLLLVERYVASARITNLHRLALGLNKSLDTAQVVKTVIEHSLQSLHTQAAAVWLRRDFVPTTNVPEDTERNRDQKEDAQNWCCIASQGFESEGHRLALAEWNIAVERGDCRDAQYHYRVEYGVADFPLLEKVLGEEDSAVSVPILWEGEVIGVMFVGNWQQRIQCDEVVLLEAIAMSAAPALQNARLFHEASLRADHDGLTELYNHRAIQQQLNTAIAFAGRTSGELAVVMMDLNNFKFFNDTYGHPVGDEIIRIAARYLDNAFRASDIIGRFGGDEFIAILPDTGAMDVVLACRRVAKLLDNLFYETEDGTRIPIPMTFGWAVFPYDGSTAMDLISHADAMLYEHKHVGGMSYLLENQNGTHEMTMAVRDEFRQLKEREWGGSFGVLDALVTAIDNKDHYTRRHSEEVTGLSLLTAKEMGLPEEILRVVYISGLLHDVGKIAVPDHILRHPGKLTDAEFDIMRQHPVFGALIVKDVPNLEAVLEGVRYHHERWDGRGYPDKLAGEDIPLMGRLLAVADCYSAMTTDRPYRKAMTREEALAEIEATKGKQFDPTIADAFTRAMSLTNKEAVVPSPEYRQALRRE